MKKGNNEKNQLSTLSSEILSIINGLSDKFGQLYCYPSQMKILTLLEKRFDVKRCRSTLNKQLKKMEKLGFIERTRRHRRDKHKGMIFKSTLYKITLNGYDHLRKIGVKVWKQINILRKILDKKMGRHELEEDKGPKKGELTKLKDIIGGLGIPGST